jgi:hypothetical protein
MSFQISTGDVYESVFYLLNGCTLEAIEGQQVNGKISCILRFTGPKIAELQAHYFQGTVEVNLFEFRRTYPKVCAWINQAKKQLKHQLEHPDDLQSKGGTQ